MILMNKGSQRHEVGQAMTDLESEDLMMEIDPTLIDSNGMIDY